MEFSPCALCSVRPRGSTPSPSRGLISRHRLRGRWCLHAQRFMGMLMGDIPPLVPTLLANHRTHLSRLPLANINFIRHKMRVKIPRGIRVVSHGLSDHIYCTKPLATLTMHMIRMILGRPINDGVVKNVRDRSSRACEAREYMLSRGLSCIFRRCNCLTRVLCVIWINNNSWIRFAWLLEFARVMDAFEKKL